MGGSILRALQLNEAEDLIDWAKAAEKEEIAALAPAVFAAAAKRDRLARKILADAALSLAEDGANCARRLAGKGAPVEFVLAGGVLLHQSAFARRVRARLRLLRPGARVTRLARESVWGTMALAKAHFTFLGSPLNRNLNLALNLNPFERLKIKSKSKIKKSEMVTQEEKMGAVSEKLPPTEQRNPRSRNLDKMPLAKAVALMIREESSVGAAVFQERRKIARAVEIIAQALRGGGRLFYAGAGTSGRLGVLDASECPPTFRLRARPRAGDHRGRTRRPLAIGGRGGGRRGGGRGGHRLPWCQQKRCPGRDRRQRADALCLGRAGGGDRTGRARHPALLPSAPGNPGGATARRGDRAGHRTGGVDRLDPPQGRDGDQGDTEHSQHAGRWCGWARS